MPKSLKKRREVVGEFRKKRIGARPLGGEDFLIFIVYVSIGERILVKHLLGRIGPLANAA